MNNKQEEIKRIIGVNIISTSLGGKDVDLKGALTIPKNIISPWMERSKL